MHQFIEVSAEEYKENVVISTYSILKFCKCIICGVYFEYNITPNKSNKYELVGYNNYYDLERLTCDEIIIKNIIEYFRIIS